MALVRLREVYIDGRVVDVWTEEVGPDMEDVKLYPVEVRTVPERNYARVIYSALLASGARVDAASFEAAAEALEREDGEAFDWGGEIDPLPNYRCLLYPRLDAEALERESETPGNDLTAEVPTTYCFDCGQMVPVADTWAKKADPNYALCEPCFRIAESAGRAKEGQK